MSHYTIQRACLACSGPLLITRAIMVSACVYNTPRYCNCSKAFHNICKAFGSMRSMVRKVLAI